jgi:hypothetical protein
VTSPPETVPSNISPSATAPPAAVEHTVVYEITGNATIAGLTYVNSDSGNTAQATDAPVPQNIAVQLATGSFYGISAQDMDPYGTSITCTVLEDGTQIATNTSTGAYAIADCHGTLP